MDGAGANKALIGFRPELLAMPSPKASSIRAASGLSTPETRRVAKNPVDSAMRGQISSSESLHPLAWHESPAGEKFSRYR